MSCVRVSRTKVSPQNAKRVVAFFGPRSQTSPRLAIQLPISSSKAKRPTSKNPNAQVEMKLKHMRNYFALANRIIELIHGMYNEDGFAFSRIPRDPNPFFCQIVPNGAMGLELHDGTPAKLWTPLGTIHFKVYAHISPDASGGAKFTELTKRLGLQVLPELDKMPSALGPVYQIKKDPDGNPLPNLILRPKDQRISHKDAIDLWRRMIY